jgi:integrase
MSPRIAPACSSRGRPSRRRGPQWSPGPGRWWRRRRAVRLGLRFRWRDVDLNGRRLRIAASKTDAGIREVDLTPALQDLLTEYRTRSRHTKQTSFVFDASCSIPVRVREDSASNIRSRFLAVAVERANVALPRAGREPIGALTPHSLRRTFISLLLAAGADVPYVMAQAGHSDPKMTLGLYAQVLTSKTDYGAALDGLVITSDWAATGSGASKRGVEGSYGTPSGHEKPRISGVCSSSG